MLNENIFESFTHSIQAYEPDEAHIILDYLKSYRKTNNSDIYTTYKKYVTYEYSLVELAEFCSEFLGHSRVTGLNDHIIVESKTGATIILTGRGCSVEKMKSDFQCYIVGNKEDLINITTYFDRKFQKKASKVDWWYTSKDGANSVSVALADPQVIYPEYYPWFENGPEEYFNRFMESSAPILFISGDPGTGKTSFLRNMIYKAGIDTYVGYDNKLFEHDGMFIDFLMGEATLMLLEDAETIVLPRKSNNSLITRFLNVSDGLLKLPMKKFIFTTNDSNFANVDQALIRPGRCFDSCEFRALTYDETKSAAEKAGVPIPKKKKDYTLAELFNQKNNTVRKVGF